MKIKSYYIEHETIYITTDSEVMPEYAYPVHTIKSLSTLLEEMEKKEKEVINRQKKSKVNIIKKQLDAEVLKNRTD